MQSLYLCSSLKRGEGAAQIVTRLISVMNKAVLIARRTRVSSTEIHVFYKASFCSYGVLKSTAALARFVACLVNFLLLLLKVFSLLLH